MFGLSEIEKIEALKLGLGGAELSFKTGKGEAARLAVNNVAANNSLTYL